MDGIYGDFDMIWTGTLAYSPILRKTDRDEMANDPILKRKKIRESHQFKNLQKSAHLAKQGG